MAQLSSLVKTIAEVEGLDETRVGWVARHCRESGLISQGGRGRGAAKMGSQDAANLLIAVNASDGGKDSYRQVMQYRRLPIIRSIFDTAYWSAMSDTEDGLYFRYLTDPALNFGGAIEKLISRCIPGDGDKSNFEKEISGRVGELSIIFERPQLTASINIITEYDEEDSKIKFSSVLRSIFGEPLTERDIQPASADRTEKIEITGRTLIAIGATLSK